jgi:hypothetical protein
MLLQREAPLKPSKRATSHGIASSGVQVQIHQSCPCLFGLAKHARISQLIPHQLVCYGTCLPPELIHSRQSIMAEQPACAHNGHSYAVSSPMNALSLSLRHPYLQESMLHSSHARAAIPPLARGVHMLAACVNSTFFQASAPVSGPSCRVHTSLTPVLSALVLLLVCPA